MARKRIPEELSIKSWAEVDEALREIAENQLALDDLEGELNRQIIGAKKIAEQQSKPHADRIAKREREIKDFVQEHRLDLGKSKSRTLSFGEVGFRLSTTVSIPTAKEKLAEVIRKLKDRKMHDCIVTEEKVSREALKKYSEDTITAVGAVFRQKDTFGYEVFKQKLARDVATPQ